MMTVTDRARERLTTLFRRQRQACAAKARFRIEGYVGTCRGSSPILKPVEKKKEGDTVVEFPDITVYIAPNCTTVLEQATLDYQSGFLGRGLTLTWPHSDGCQCQCGK